MKTRKTILFFGIMAMIPVLLTTFCLAADNTLPKKHYAIKAQNLRSALEAYQDQSGQNIAYSDVLVDGKVSNAINETCDSLQAITTILKGTGLGFKATEHGTLVLVPNAPDSQSRNHRGNRQMHDSREHSSLKMPRMSMDEMVVTATKTAIKTKKVPAAISVVTSQDFKIKTKTDDFFDAVRTVPGVVTDESNSMGWPTMFIRGELPSILINGRNVRHAGGYTLDSALMAMGAVERIEVLKGPQSTMYGGRAIAGTVNIITKKGDKDHPYAEVNTLYGSGKELTGGVMFSGGTDKLSYFVNTYGATKAEWNTPKGKIPYVERDQQNFYARFDYDFLPEHTLSLEYTYNEVSHKTGGKGYQHEDVGFFFRKIWDIDPALLHAAYLSYEGNFSDWFSLYATFGGGKNDLDYQYGYNGFDEKTPLDDYLGGTNYTKMRNDFLYGEIRGTMNFLSENRLRIITGISYKNTDVDFTAKHKEPKRAFDYSETETYISSYIQAEYKPIDYAMFVTGIRYDEYSYEKSSKKDATSSRFGISLFPFAHTNYDWTTLWSSYSEAFNPPVPGLLQMPKRMGSNPDLKPEKIKGWEFGIKQRVSRWASLEASYFDTDYDDLIARLKHVPGGLGGYYDNIDEANLKGWEFMCEIYPLDWLILHFGYSDLEKKNRKTGKKMNPMMTPDTILNYGVSIVDLYGFSGSIWGRQYQNYKNPPFHQKTMGDTQPSEGKTVWDMKILYHWDIKEGLSCEPFITIHNLSNETYYVGGANYNLMEERTYQAGISFKMDF